MQRQAALIATFETPWGPIHAAATDRGIAAVALLAPRDSFVTDVSHTREVLSDATRARVERRHLDALETAFARYVGSGDAEFNVPLDLEVGSAWDRLVLEGVRSIAPGRVASYGELAARVGRFGAARAVGGAVGRNPIAILIPCHRIVAAGGRLGGYGGDWHGTREEHLLLKRDLLRHEGAVLPDDPALPGGDQGRRGPFGPARHAAPSPAR